VEAVEGVKELPIIKLAYGTVNLEAVLPDNNYAGLLRRGSWVSGDEEQEIRQALENPVGTQHLREIIHPGERICIITSDITRPFPTARVLPQIVREIITAGVAYEDITVVFALGIHRQHTEAEQKYLLGDLFGRVRALDSDPQDTVLIGTTSRGTPIEVFRPVLEADRRICLGNIEYHYFAGYSGGMKAIIPGVCTQRTISANHGMMLLPQARAGVLEGNPVREDIDEVAGMVKADFILNVILEENKRIAAAVAGDVITAHRAGCKLLDKIYKRVIPQPVDVALVSAGGFPKDINLYQAQKALDNAKYAVKPGGVIILVASCREGFGEDTFQRWIEDKSGPGQWMTDIKEHFELGGHKAAALGDVVSRYQVLLVSDLPDETVKKLGMKPFGEIQDAVDEALRLTRHQGRVLVIPQGGSVLPVVSHSAVRR